MALILIIEDDPASLELASYLLQAAGHRTRTAGDGAAGLAAARAEQLDLLICDLQIPIVDGFGVVRALKADRG
ncbi:MAG: response regulator, partial [Steroidobacterales bacterium]